MAALLPSGVEQNDPGLGESQLPEVLAGLDSDLGLNRETAGKKTKTNGLSLLQNSNKTRLVAG